MKKLQKYILILNLLLISIAGFFLSKMSNVVYRNKRINAFREVENINLLFMDNITFYINALWVVWIGMVILGIYSLVLEYKRIKKV